MIPPESDTITVNETPLRAFTLPVERDLLGASTPTTWYVRMSVNCSMFSGRSSLAKVPAGRSANASLVGAE
jgi:hypothetical protein